MLQSSLQTWLLKITRDTEEDCCYPLKAVTIVKTEEKHYDYY